MKLNFLKNDLKSLLLGVLTVFLLVIILVADVTYVSAENRKPQLSFYAINVGQGDSSLFILPDGRTILIDAGPEDAGRHVVRFLKDCGVKRIDLLVATHAHSDHIGGMKAVIAAFPIGTVWDSGFLHGSPIQSNFYKTINKKSIPFGRPKRGFTKKMGDVLIEVLAPSMLLHGTESDANNNCLVLRISYGKVSFLMAADMEREQRATIRPLPSSTVLKAAHHGSSNGTDMILLKEISPSLIILSYGHGNSYGYPHKEVVKAILKTRAKRFDTKKGTINIRTDGIKLTYPENKEVH